MRITSRAIEYLYNNPFERQRLGRNAAKYASRHLGAENTARTLNVLYDRLLHQSKRLHAWNRSPETLTPDETNTNIEAPSAGRLFADALGEHVGAFRQSLLSGPEAIEADRMIAASSDLEAKAGFLRYRAFDETDPHVRLWTGLYFEQKGNSRECHLGIRSRHRTRTFRRLARAMVPRPYPGRHRQRIRGPSYL